jgi:hypothetical protein
MRGIRIGIGAIAAVLLVGGACLASGAPLEFALALVFGWTSYLGRVVPRVAIHWPGVATVALCLALFAAGFHLFVRWLASELRRPEGGGRWRARWTAAVAGVFVLMFVAGLATVGIAHQAGWLLSSERPWTEHRVAWPYSRDPERSLREIGVAAANAQEVGSDPRRPDGLKGGLHSLQTLMLPYLWFALPEVDFELPWDHPRNAPTFRTFVPVYLNPEIGALRTADGFAMSHYAGNVHVLGPGRGPKAGLPGSTILFGEAAGDFRAWGDPKNVRDPSMGLCRSPGGFGNVAQTGARFALMDGSVRFIRTGVDPRVLRALGAPAEGESVRADEAKR